MILFLLVVGFVITASGQSIGQTFNFNREISNVVYGRDSKYGFEPGQKVECVDRSIVKGRTSGACFSDTPFYFSAALPEGNYKVTITFGDEQSATSTVVKAELRRLMLESVDTAKGKFTTRSFIVNVRNPQISTGSEVKLKDREKTSERWSWDEKLTLEFNGTRPTVRSIKIETVNVPTVFLLGDSTVCDQPGEPYASWGQMITRFFGDKVAVANHAESGESLKSSFGAKRLDKVLSQMKRGDYLMIQYGHNDMKEKGDGIGAFTSYKASLKQYVNAAKTKGATVILINPMHRRTFDADGRITNSHGDYPEAVRQAAKEENVAFIDLHSMSKDLYESFGKDGSGVLFKEGDGTHHSKFGAFELAKCIVQSIRDQKLPLSKFLVKGLPKFDPKKPDDPKITVIPASPVVTDLKPLGS